MKRYAVYTALLCILLFIAALTIEAAPVSVMKGTKHDLSYRTDSVIHASSPNMTDICVFCHTPHSARTDAPLWNRKDPAGPYTVYSSDVMGAMGYPSPEQPTSVIGSADVHAKTRICLSCHDGTIAVGHLVNLPFGFTGDIGMTGTGVTAGKLNPAAAGYVGLDLRDDHPVAVVYKGADPELKGSMTGNVKGYDAATGSKVTTAGNTTYIECTSCHNAHDNQFGNFLVMSNQNSGLCVSCHNKTGYTSSIHDTSSQAYNPSDGLAGGTLGDTVGSPNGVKCMACHFPHKAGVTAAAPTMPNPGGGLYLLSFQEESSCFNNPDRWGTAGISSACHSNGATGTKKDIQSETGGGGLSGKTSGHHVGNYNNLHRATEGKDYNPNGWLGTTAWHVECQDCHNPHTSGSMSHAQGTNTISSSSVLYGAGGVQMQSWPTAWMAPTAINFTYLEPVGVTTNAAVSPSYEYEVCFKCHSSFAWGMGTKPTTFAGAPLTDQAMEFNWNNASYHAVASNGVSGTSKAHNQGAYTGGWAYNSTMTCSDCHGNDGSTTPKGPHGSNNRAILRRAYDPATVGQNTTSDLCYACHDPSTYYNNSNGITTTGFRDGTRNLHYYHMNAAGFSYLNGVPRRCTGCHSTPPHGSNKSHMISYSTDGAPYGTYSSLISYTDPGSGNYIKQNCSASACHAGAHL